MTKHRALRSRSSVGNYIIIYMLTFKLCMLRIVFFGLCNVPPSSVIHLSTEQEGDESGRPAETGSSCLAVLRTHWAPGSHRWGRPLARACRSVMLGVWGWRRSGRAPVHRSLSAGACAAAARISPLRRWTREEQEIPLLGCSGRISTIN